MLCLKPVSKKIINLQLILAKFCKPIEYGTKVIKSVHSSAFALAARNHENEIFLKETQTQSL